MRGAFAVALVISLAAAITAFQMSGAAAVFPTCGGDFSTDDALVEQTDGNLDPNDQGITGSASEQEGSIVGLIVSGTQAIFTFVGTVVLLPAELNNLCMPWWLAYPVGLVLQVVATITAIQFAVNRVLA